MRDNRTRVPYLEDKSHHNVASSVVSLNALDEMLRQCEYITWNIDAIIGEIINSADLRCESRILLVYK